MIDDSLLLARQITRYYHGRRVLHDVDIELRRGEVLGFLGPNGAGKSTTMNILAGVLPAHAGSVTICGAEMAKDPLRAKRHIGYLPEHPPIYLDSTVDEYLRYCGALRGLKGRDVNDAVARAKQDCELDSVGTRLIANLSKGFRQRVGIAQAIIHRPALVILDEPTSGLDPNQIRGVRALLSELSEQHAVILSTHVLAEAQTLCSRVTVLHHGRICFNEPVESNNENVRIRLRTAPGSMNLTDIDGVIACETLGDNAYRLTTTDYDRVAERVTKIAVEQDWGLCEIYRDSSPLEQVFVDLTCNDDELIP